MPKESSTSMFYFAFTSFTTVGLGDYHPRSDLERLLGAFGLLFGVAVTSYVMENITQTSRAIMDFLAEYDESDKLSTFLNTMMKFNEGHPLDESLNSEIVKYFDYRWKQNRNFFASTDDDEFMLEQLPISIRRRIFMDFVYDDFLVRYSNFFSLVEGEQSLEQAAGQLNLEPTCTSWDPDQFQELLVIILR